MPTFSVGYGAGIRGTQTLVFDMQSSKRASAAADYAATSESVYNFVTNWFGPLKRRVSVIELPDADDTPFDSGAALFTPLKTMERKTLQVMLRSGFRCSIGDDRDASSSYVSVTSSTLHGTRSQSRGLALVQQHVTDENPVYAEAS